MKDAHRGLRITSCSSIIEVSVEDSIKFFDIRTRSLKVYTPSKTPCPMYMTILGNRIVQITDEYNSVGATSIDFMDIESNGRAYSTRLKHSVIRAVQRPGVICVVAEKTLSLIRAIDGSILKQISTTKNPYGCCDASTWTDRLVVCCPGLQRGTLRIERLPSESQSSSSVVAVHEAGLQAIAVSGNGAYVATISETGSLIRVHSTVEPCDLLIEHRRTSLLKAPRVVDLFISPTGSFVGIVDVGTFLISIFKTPVSISSHLLLRTSEDKGPMSVFSSFASECQKCLTGTSAWATFNIPSMNSSVSFVTASFGPDPYTLIVAAATSAGPVGFLYRFDPMDKNTVTVAKCEYIERTTPNEEEIIEIEKSVIAEDGVISDDSTEWTLLNFSSSNNSEYISW